jgi:two-component system OmpR family response regulator/two-component system phosphate regulon response regulator PhoB
MVIDMTAILDSHKEDSETASPGIVVLVEDDADTREFLTECIESETLYHVVSFASGDELLQRLEEVQGLKPILLLLDFYLSGMSLFQLYDHLLTLEGFASVPALIVTAATLTEQMQSTLTERGLAVLPKPFGIPDLLDSIELALRHADVEAV